MTRALALATVALLAAPAYAGPDICVWTRPDRPPVVCVPHGGGGR